MSPAEFGVNIFESLSQDGSDRRHVNEHYGNPHESINHCHNLAHGSFRNNVSVSWRHWLRFKILSSSGSSLLKKGNFFSIKTPKYGQMMFRCSGEGQVTGRWSSKWQKPSDKSLTLLHWELEKTTPWNNLYDFLILVNKSDSSSKSLTLVDLQLVLDVDNTDSGGHGHAVHQAGAECPDSDPWL